MLYLFGVNLPDRKVVSVALTYIYGIGPKTAERICHQLLIHKQCQLRELSEVKVNQLSEVLSKLTIEQDLKRQISKNIQHLEEIGCYVGRRHLSGLPVHGQNTRNNAKTAKKLSKRRGYFT